MIKLIISRLGQGILVLLIVSAITFALLAAAGGDAFSTLNANPATSQQTITSLRRTYGLDRPLYARYATWIGGIIQGDLGRSTYYDAPVWSVLKPRMLATLELSTTALAFALIAAFLLGPLAARKPSGIADRLCVAGVTVAASVPRIVAALVTLAIVVQTSMFALGDSGNGSSQSILRLIVTAFVLSLPLMAVFVAQLQDSLKEAMGAEYILVARAKGLSEWQLLLKHAMRNAVNPIITISGYSLGGLVSSSVIVETVLGWPGLGQISVTAVRSRDVPLLMGLVLVTAAIVLLGNLLADLLLRANDPLIREGDKRMPASLREPVA